MSDFMHHEQLELRLKDELDEAERQLQAAPPHELGEARGHYRKALHAFTRLVVDGILPDE